MRLRSRIDPSASAGGRGRFAQVAGFSLVYDPAGTPMLIDLDGSALEPGTRVVAVELDYVENALGSEITAADYPEGGEGRITQLP
jgi:hypothetical protein